MNRQLMKVCLIAILISRTASFINQFPKKFE